MSVALPDIGVKISRSFISQTLIDTSHLCVAACAERELPLGTKFILSSYRDLVNAPQGRLCNRRQTVRHGALKCRKLEKAEPSAKELLEVEPQYVPALAVEMIRVQKQGDPKAAREIAKRILELEQDPGNPWHRMALEVQQKALETTSCRGRRGCYPPALVRCL